LGEKNPNIHFGMDDVSHRINAFREKILMLSMEAFSNVSARTLEAVLNDPQEGEVNALNLSASELEAVLARMAGKINSSTRSIILSNLEGKEAGRNVLVNKFIENLVQEYDKQRYFEEQIKKFVEACNKYLFGKCFLYNPADASVKVFRKDVKGNILYDEGNIELSCFSSGEKQLVALMSCLYLEEKQKYILLYDEPETSISIFWQEELLSDIMDSGNVDQMIVVTHSPYIFKKNPEVAFGLQEFAYDRE